MLTFNVAHPGLIALFAHNFCGPVNPILRLPPYHPARLIFDRKEFLSWE